MLSQDWPLLQQLRVIEHPVTVKLRRGVLSAIHTKVLELYDSLRDHLSTRNFDCVDRCLADLMTLKESLPGAENINYDPDDLRSRIAPYRRVLGA